MYANAVTPLGFLSINPRLKVEGVGRVSRLARQLPSLIAAGSDVLRKELIALPFLANVPAVDAGRLRALMRDYHYLQSAYVHAEPGVTKIPATLAVPSFLVAQVLGQKPILSYASVVLENWEFECEGITNLGIRPIVTFTGTEDEKGFILAHVRIEEKAGDALHTLPLLFDDVRQRREDEVRERLMHMAQTIAAARVLFRAITKLCDPRVYFDRIRPWMYGFKGVVYEGVPEYQNLPQSFIGASGAQSSVLPALDAALGICHDSSYCSAYVEKLRLYMPPGHRRFIEGSENAPSLRKFVLESGSADLRHAYNAAVESLRAFRVAHTGFATRYIGMYGKVRGTGDTHYQELFEQYEKDTEAALL